MYGEQYITFPFKFQIIAFAPLVKGQDAPYLFLTAAG